MTRHRKIILLVVAGICVVVVCSLAYAQKRIREQTKPAVDFEASLDDVVAEQPLKHVTGTILAVSGNTFQLKILGVADPEVDPSLYERKVRIAPQTALKVVVKREDNVVKEEMEAFQLAMASFEERRAREAVAAPPAPPVIFDTKTGSVGELKVGQEVSIITDEDIRFKKEFTASKIEVLPEAG